MSECAGCGRVEGCCLCELLGYFPSVSALHTKHSNTVSGRNLWDLHQPELSQTVVWLWPGCWHSGDITHRKKFFLSWKPIDWALAESSFITAWSGDSADNESRWHQPLVVPLPSAVSRSVLLFIVLWENNFNGPPPPWMCTDCIVSNIWFWSQTGATIFTDAKFCWREVVEAFNN